MAGQLSAQPIPRVNRQGTAIPGAATVTPVNRQGLAIPQSTTRTVAPAAAPAPANTNAAPGGGLFGGLRTQMSTALQNGVAAAKPVVAQAQATRNAAIASNTPDTIDEQTGAARALGAGIQKQGGSIFNQQTAAANNYGTQGAGYNATAQSITAPGGMAGPAPAAPPSGGALHQIGGSLVTGGRINSGIQTPPPAGPPAFQVGQRATAGNMGSVSNVDPSALGGYGSVAGGLGGAPGAVSTAGLGGVGMTAGQLGAGPQVGNVGNIGTGAAPGAVAGTFGNQGAQSADQAGMMARLNGFLDAPEGPSVAESQLKQAQAQNMGQMIGLARSGRGGAGAQAQALEGAMSEGGAVASDTAGQLATLRAQEEDMRKNRALSAIGLGGSMATDARGQDLSYRGQNLAAAQGDQSTSLGARGQDLSASMANQQTQTQLEGLRAQTALGARGQDLSALQGDQSAQLGVRGQNLSAEQGNQSTALGARGQNLDALSTDVQAQIAARGQNLGALQGNQQAQLGVRGQNVTQEGNILGANTTMRQQDVGALQSDADRNLAAQQLSLQGKLGFGGLQNEAQGQGLQYLSQANQQALGAEGLAQSATSDYNNMVAGINNTNTMADAGIQQSNNANKDNLSFAERLALVGVGGLFNAGGAIGGAYAGK